ncbi:hypothetical protein AC578_9266 [Pseudocercospora eumusae]|uniref:Uncharacterized protein n=1 Tax=Pseudocercospora eumusae TaxID=321146 RepID=A0A139HNE4_9PEZI|nr:hypothetical protein AC578_9266 [Pseudocercospora eumusae]
MTTLSGSTSLRQSRSKAILISVTLVCGCTTAFVYGLCPSQVLDITLAMHRDSSVAITREYRMPTMTGEIEPLEIPFKKSAQIIALWDIIQATIAWWQSHSNAVFGSEAHPQLTDEQDEVRLIGISSLSIGFRLSVLEQQPLPQNCGVDSVLQHWMLG